MSDCKLQAQARIPTPLGDLTLAASERGLAIAWFDGQNHRSAELVAPVAPEHPHLRHAAAELADYWEAPTMRFTVPLDPLWGTPFQLEVWQVLRGIAPGSLLTYADVARRIGKPAAMRAVGAAIGRNPIGIVVPCHRVVGSGGGLTGYAAGLERKKALLRLEGAIP